MVERVPLKRPLIRLRQKKYPRGGGDSKSTRAQLEARERIKQIIDLRLKNYTYLEIGPMVGMKPASCSAAFWKYIKSLPDEDAHDLRLEMNNRLRTISRELWNHFDRSPSRAAEVLVKVEERMAKLNGLDAPTQTEISGPNGGPIQTVSLDLFAEMRRRYEESNRQNFTIPTSSRKMFPVFPITN